MKCSCLIDFKISLICSATTGHQRLQHNFRWTKTRLFIKILYFSFWFCCIFLINLKKIYWDKQNQKYVSYLFFELLHEHENKTTGTRTMGTFSPQKKNKKTICTLLKGLIIKMYLKVNLYLLYPYNGSDNYGNMHTLTYLCS